MRTNLENWKMYIQTALDCDNDVFVKTVILTTMKDLLRRLQTATFKEH